MYLNKTENDALSPSNDDICQIVRNFFKILNWLFFLLIQIFLIHIGILKS